MKRIIQVACSVTVLVILFACNSEKERLANRIASGEQMLINDSTKLLDHAVGVRVLKDYIDYSDLYKEDSLTPSYLFKAADLANGLQQPKESIAIYDRLLKDYPDYKKAPAALFMEGFIYDTVLKDKEKAKEIYMLFLNKYPDHPLAQSAQSSLEQINSGLSDEELIHQFEEQLKLKSK